MLSHSLGIFFNFSPDFTMHIKTSIPPVQYPLYKIPVDQLFAKEQQEDLACEKSAEQRIVEA